MSEQQVLPPIELIERWERSEDQPYMKVIPNGEFVRWHHYRDARASLAQSEAERERLQGENIKLLNDASVWRNRAIGAEEEIREGGRGIDLRIGFER